MNDTIHYKETLQQLELPIKKPIRNTDKPYDSGTINSLTVLEWIEEYAKESLRGSIHDKPRWAE